MALGGDSSHLGKASQGLHVNLDDGSVRLRSVAHGSGKAAGVEGTRQRDDVAVVYLTTPR